MLSYPMTVTMDTNILFAALHSSAGASHLILRLVINEQLRISLTNTLLLEYQDVLPRPANLEKLAMTADDVLTVLDTLAALARKHAVWFRLRPNLADESDNMVVECAVAGNVDFLLTHNVRDFAGGELQGFPFTTLTPREFIQHWRKNHE